MLVLEEQKEYNLSGKIEFCPAQDSLFTIHDAVRKFNNNEFVEYSDSSLSLNYNEQYWICFSVLNNTKSLLPWSVRFNSPFTHVDLYAISYNKEKKAYDTILKSNESVNSIHKIQIPCCPVAGVETQYFIKLSSQLPLPCDFKKISICPYDDFFTSFIEQSNLVGFVIGMLFIMLVYNLFNLINNKKRVTLYYVIYIFCHIVFVFQGSYLMEYVVVKQNQFSFAWLYLSFSYGVIFYILFVRDFLEPRNIPVWLDTWFYKPYIVFVIIANILMTLLFVFNNSIFFILVFQIPVIYGFFGLSLVILLFIYVKHPLSKWVLIGTSITIITGILSILLDAYGFVNNNHVYNIGMVVDVLFFSYALSLKHKYEVAEIKRQEIFYRELQYNMDTQKRELTSKALLIQHQDKLISELHEKFKNLKKTDFISNDEVHSVIHSIEMHVNQNSWDEFERYFVEVHPSFYTSLKETYPQLTQNELRICALLKLNLNTKSIADITQKTAKSIDVTRSRIRQKMGLSRDENLFDIIAGI